MSLTLVTITGKLVGPNERPASGGMTFELVTSTGTPTSLTDTSTGEIVLPALVQGQVRTGQLLWLAPSGYLPLQLVANDDPTSTPTGTKYRVTENLGATLNVGPWTLTVHHTVATLTIGSVRPA